MTPRIKTDAWMPLWIGAYLADTLHLSRDEHGGYLMLIMAYWRSSQPLIDDDKRLAAITKSTPEEWVELRKTLSGFFVIEKGVWRHKRIEQELESASKFKEKQHANGLKGGRPRKSQSQLENNPNETQTKPKHNPNETQTKPKHNPNETQPITQLVENNNPLILDVRVDNAENNPNETQTKPKHEKYTENNPNETQTKPKHNPNHNPNITSTPTPTPTHINTNNARAYLENEVEVKNFSSVCVETVNSGKAKKPSPAGDICRAMVKAGVAGCNPSHPTLIALIEAGAEVQDFVNLANSINDTSKKTFAYLLGTLKRQREAAASLVLYQGKARNKQEALEASNRAVASNWMPPELRGASQTEIDRVLSGDAHANQ